MERKQEFYKPKSATDILDDPSFDAKQSDVIELSDLGNDKTANFDHRVQNFVITDDSISSKPGFLDRLSRGKFYPKQDVDIAANRVLFKNGIVSTGFGNVDIDGSVSIVGDIQNTGDSNTLRFSLRATSDIEIAGNIDSNVEIISDTGNISIKGHFLEDPTPASRQWGYRLPGYQVHNVRIQSVNGYVILDVGSIKNLPNNLSGHQIFAEKGFVLFPEELDGGALLIRADIDRNSVGDAKKFVKAWQSTEDKEEVLRNTKHYVVEYSPDGTFSIPEPVGILRTGEEIQGSDTFKNAKEVDELGDNKATVDIQSKSALVVHDKEVRNDPDERRFWQDGDAPETQIVHIEAPDVLFDQGFQGFEGSEVHVNGNVAVTGSIFTIGGSSKTHLVSTGSVEISDSKIYRASVSAEDDIMINGKIVDVEDTSFVSRNGNIIIELPSIYDLPAKDTATVTGGGSYDIFPEGEKYGISAPNGQIIIHVPEMDVPIVLEGEYSLKAAIDYAKTVDPDIREIFELPEIEMERYLSTSADRTIPVSRYWVCPGFDSRFERITGVLIQEPDDVLEAIKRLNDKGIEAYPKGHSGIDQEFRDASSGNTELQETEKALEQNHGIQEEQDNVSDLHVLGSSPGGR